MSKLVNDWVDKVTDIIYKIHPDINIKEVKTILHEIVGEYKKSPKSVLHNDYLDDFNIRTDLESLYDWIEAKKPVCAGNGTFFYNQDKVDSPIGKLIDDRQSDRKMYQKIRDTFEPGSYEYRHNDMLQMEAKLKINSIYGAFGAATFQLFNLYTASATTASAQSLISTTAVAFESLLTNSVKFESIDQCLVFVDNVLNDETKLSLDGIDMITSSDIIFRRLRGNFKQGTYKSEYDDIILRLIKNCNEEELTRLYYKNNIYPFIETPLIRQIIIDMYNSADSYKDPYNPDERMLPHLNKLWDYFKEFVLYNHFFVERIRRLKQDTRQSVLVIDTDSK